MGSFANRIAINAETGRYTGSPAVAVINAAASATSVANRAQPLNFTSTNSNLLILGEYTTHIGVRARYTSAVTVITTNPAVNIYRLYGPESAFATTTLANDGTIQFDTVNHGQSYAGATSGTVYAETIQAYQFGAVLSTGAVTASLRDASYVYSEWARGDAVPFWQYDGTAAAITGGSDQVQLIPTRGARAIIVLCGTAASITNGAVDIVVQPFARGNME